MTIHLTRTIPLAGQDTPVEIEARVYLPRHPAIDDLPDAEILHAVDAAGKDRSQSIGYDQAQEIEQDAITEAQRLR